MRASESIHHVNAGPVTPIINKKSLQYKGFKFEMTDMMLPKYFTGRFLK